MWANFKALIGIFSQSVGPSLAIWANLVQFTLERTVVAIARGVCQRVLAAVASAEHLVLEAGGQGHDALLAWGENSRSAMVANGR